MIDILKPPFSNEEEYRQYVEKEESINLWTQHILNTIIPGSKVYDVWEGKKGLMIDCTHGGEDEQTWIPIACLWSEDWEKLNKEAKEEANRQWKEKEEKRLSKEAAIREANERAWLAKLKEKYEGNEV